MNTSYNVHSQQFQLPCNLGSVNAQVIIKRDDPLPSSPPSVTQTSPLSYQLLCSDAVRINNTSLM